MLHSPVLPEIEKLDAVRDHQRIAFLSCRVDFPWDTTRALEFALFRKEFEKRAQKRYDDTDIIVSEMMEHGYDSERGRAALARMNALHGRFKIRNEDFLYVLSTFVFVPIRWNKRFGWRRMIEKERVALFHFWREVGKRMNIQDIPATYGEFEKYNIEYERVNYRYTETNHRVGVATRNLFMSWFPRWTAPVVKRAIYAFMDDSLITAFGFPQPSPFMRGLVDFGLKVRAWFLRIFPRRKRPLLRTEMTHPSYPQGYAIEKVGPPEMGGGCPFHIKS